MDNLSFQIKFNSFFLTKAIILSLILLCWGCSQKKEEQNLSEKSSEFPQGIWQLDYYPDSILFHKSINDYSIWSSQYAYNLEFVSDSVQFIGCHESWWNKIIKLDDSTFRTKSEYNQYWELKVSNSKIEIRETNKDVKTEYFPYHKTKKVLTLEAIEKIIAKEVFTGDYQVLFSDSIQCDPIIHFTDDLHVDGIKGIDKFHIEVFMDWDFPLDNYFSLYGNDQWTRGYSFQFRGDTLKLINYEILQDEEGIGYPSLTKPAFIFKKRKI